MPDTPDVPADLRTASEAAFAALLATVDLPRHGWQMHALARRVDKRMRRAVFRVTHPDHRPLIFRHVRRPWTPEAFAESYRWQAEVHDRFPHSPTATAASVTALLADQQASLTECLPGETMTHFLASPDAPMERLLDAAGRWARLYHGLDGFGMAPFAAAPLLARWRVVGRKVRSGEGVVPAPEIVLRGVDWLERNAMALDGAETPHGLRHGDFTGQNLIWSEGRLGGIDFDPPARGPVALDLAAFLIDHGKLRGGTPFARGAAQALLDGHGTLRADDPMLAVAAGAEILDTIMRVPGHPQNRGPGKRRLLRQILPSAEALFGSG